MWHYKESNMFWRHPMGQFRTERYGGFLYIWVEGCNHSKHGFWHLLCKRKEAVVRK